MGLLDSGGSGLAAGKKKRADFSGDERFRYLTLALSVSFPILLVVYLKYDVRLEYLNRTEMMWMFAGNIIYYLLAIPMAFIFKDKRAFCKIACPVSLVMKVPTSVCLVTIKPSGEKCLKCSKCNKHCPMDVDVMSYISRGEKIRSTECVLCMECKFACVAGAIK